MADKKSHGCIHNMELHAWAKVNDGISILRVPGGWIYTQTIRCTNDETGAEFKAVNSTFVPLSHEFKQSSGWFDVFLNDPDIDPY